MMLDAADKTTLNLPIFSHTWSIFQIRVVISVCFLTIEIPPNSIIIFHQLPITITIIEIS